MPHVLILAMMAVSVAQAEGDERGFAGYLVFLEIYVVPVALLLAAGVSFVPRLGAWSMGIVWSTFAGAIVVLLAALVVGNAETWS